MSINYGKRPDSQVTNSYLRMLAQACGELSRNKGAERKKIWNYFQEKYENENISYQTFLLSINSLLKDGLVINKNGYYIIERETYQELHAQYIKKEQESKLQRNNKFSPGGANKDFKKKSAGRLSAHCPKGTQLMASRTYAMLLNGNSGAIDPAKKTFDGKMRKPNSSGKS